jgi:hypothetical protein
MIVINKKERLLAHYIHNVRWSILLYIKYIRENEYPNQLSYWKQQLKKDLAARKRILSELKNLEISTDALQLTFEF